VIDKARNMVGLDIDPAGHAVVLCVFEKSQNEALDRAPTALPIQPGQAERCTYDDARQGTTSLCALFLMMVTASSATPPAPSRRN
jgi:hypothetical protein